MADSQYARLLTQGTLYGSALQLSNVSAVLPILCVKWGSLWVAALLYPAFSVGIIAGFAASPLVLGRSRHRKHLVFAGGCMSMATLIGGTALAAWGGWGINAVFFIVSAALGIAKGICDGAHRELVSAKLPVRRRSGMILTEYAIGAVVIGVATLVVLPVLCGRGARDGDVTVLWFGAAGMVAAAAAALLVGPVHAHASAVIPRLGDTVRRGVVVMKSQRWFRWYALTQLLFVPITLGATFYALHMPVHSADGRGSLPLVVVCASLGLLIGSYLWRAVHRVAGVRGMLIGGALMAVCSAGICVLAHAVGWWSQGWVWVHGLLFLLAAAADQAVYAASIEWIGMFADEYDRPILVGFTAAAAALAASLVGVLVGVIAPHTYAVWPALVLLALNVFAVVAALRALSPVVEPASSAQNLGDFRAERRLEAVSADSTV